jgi:outer membrane protein TolC
MQSEKRKVHLSLASSIVLMCLLVIATAFLASRAPAAATQAAGSAEQGPSGSIERLRALQAERYKTLKKVVESMRPFFEAGRIDLTEMRDAEVAVCRAEADLCATPAERIKVYEKFVELQQTYETNTARKAASGRAGQWEVDKARVATLEAQIELETLRLGQAR